MIAPVGPLTRVGKSVGTVGGRLASGADDLLAMRSARIPVAAASSSPVKIPVHVAESAAQSAPSAASSYASHSYSHSASHIPSQMMKPSAVNTTALAAGAVGGAIAAGAMTGNSTSPIMGALDTGINTIGTVSGFVGMGMLVPMVGALAGNAARLSGKWTGVAKVENAGKGFLSKLENFSSATNEEALKKIAPKAAEKLKQSERTIGGTKIGKMGALHTVSHAAWIAGSAVGMYGVARDFSQKLIALRTLEADMRGVALEDVSARQVLTGTVSQPVAAARKILLATEGAHGLAHAAGLFVNLKSLQNANFLSSTIISLIAFQAPDMIAQAVDGYVGASPLDMYSGMRNAFIAGEVLPPQAYAELLMAGSDLNMRGKTGEAFALKLGDQFAAEHKSPAEVLAEIHNGGMKKRIEAIEAEYAKSHVAKVQGASPTAEQPVIGKHTGQVVNGPKTIAKAPAVEQEVVGKYTSAEKLADMTPASLAKN